MSAAAQPEVGAVREHAAAAARGVVAGGAPDVADGGPPGAAAGDAPGAAAGSAPVVADGARGVDGSPAGRDTEEAPEIGDAEESEPEPEPAVRRRPVGPDRWSRSAAPASGSGGRAARSGSRSSRRARAQEPPSTGAAAVDPEPEPESVARSIALRLLTGAPRSRAQLADAMARRDVPDEVADRVLDRFTEVGLIDDAEYARILVRSRHADRGLARRALGVELRRKGIDDELAAAALDTVDPDQEEATARELVRRRLAATVGLASEVRMRRVVAMLGRKGYSGGLAHRLVREGLAAEAVSGEPASTRWTGRGSAVAGPSDEVWDTDETGPDPGVFADDD